ncbi:MAG: hypothetical protein KKG35_03000 [Proteobacteria bacterium]|nr:hypothetical protein [Pseudomonadota bacterium]
MEDDHDGDFDALDMCIIEEVEKEVKDNKGGNSGCCLILLAPVLGVATIVGSYFII